MAGLLSRLFGKSASAPDVDALVGAARDAVREGNPALALDNLRRAVAAAPRHGEAQALLGYVAHDIGQVDLARRALDAALDIDPRHVEALNTRGVMAADDADPAPSIAWFERALAVDPANPATAYNLAQRLFFHGDWARGFELFAARHRLHHGRDNPLAPLPCWHGEALAGRAIFVWCDWGGLGDHLMFARYVGRLHHRARPARIVVGARPECARLFARLPGVERVLTPGEAPAVDVHVPLFDLPRLLGVEPDGAPYLRAEPAAATPPATGPLRLGLVWRTDQRAAKAAHERTRLAKSLAPQDLAPLAAIPARFVALQPDATDAELREAPIPLQRAELPLTDLDATARVIAGLDGVISIDSAVAHLAGALGADATLLLRNAGGMFWPRTSASTPWYPSMTLLRQDTEGDWGVPVAAARDYWVSKLR